MSKASEYAEAHRKLMAPAVHTSAFGLMAHVTATGLLDLHAAVIGSNDAIKLARWILDVFGDSAPEGT